MGRAPCCEETGLKKGPWSSDEDKILLDYINHNGPGSWPAVPILAGLRRCGKSCRLRWTNYLRPDIRRGPFTQEEEQTIVLLHAIFGSRWSTIASHLPGRTDNEIKNFWNTYLKKRLLKMGLDPSTHAPRSEENKPKPNGLLRHRAQWESARLEAEARLSRETQIMSTSTASYYTNSTVEIMMPNINSPADYFLKIWYSDAGEAFRRESSSRSNKSCNNSCDVFDPSGIGGNQVPSTEFPKSEIPTTSHPVSSLCSDFTQHCFHQSLHPNDKANDNDSQQCNFASANWITNCRVITHEANSSPAAVSIGQVEHKAPEDSYNSEELGHSGGHCTAFSEILMDFPDNNIASMITELGTNFRQHSVWPWPELHLEDDKDYCGNASII